MDKHSNLKIINNINNSEYEKTSKVNNISQDINLRYKKPPKFELADPAEHESPSTPLLKSPNSSNKPALASPEIIDIEDDPRSPRPDPGIDDGLLDPTFHTNGVPDIHSRAGGDGDEADKGVDDPDGSKGHPEDGYGHHHHEIELGSIPDISLPDVNVYQHKKTLAQGMMDLALFSANANQLRYVLESYDRHPYYYPSIVLIAMSLFLQVAVGIGLIWNATYNVKDEKEICLANKINNFTVVGIFLVTVVNVFISAFGVANAPEK